jgi:NOL1/NOP2/fmu family ribosome biogenesis protein
MRQRRILSDAWTSLKENGILIYSTCSYSKEEDEDVCDWLCDSFSVESLRVKTEDKWNIVETTSDKHQAAGYRFFPDKVKGEGFFIACFKKRDGEPEFSGYTKKNRMPRLNTKESAIARIWLERPDDFSFYSTGREEVFALPSVFENELAVIYGQLYVKKAGVSVGRLMSSELIPAHELALSVAVNKTINSISLKKEEALQYLRKEEVRLENSMKGWALVKYEGLNLGWVKLLHNRINNYYPKEWRILKT